MSQSRVETPWGGKTGGASEGHRSTLVDVARLRAQETPEAEVYTFLTDGEGASLTCGELDRRARTIAVALRDAAARGDRVLLLYPPGLEFITGFFGCLYAGVIAVPAYPPSPARLAQT